MKLIVIRLDGHNRYVICEEQGREYQILEMSFSDLNSAKIWVIGNQLGRRNINQYQRGELVLKMKDLIATRAKERQKTSTGGAHPQPLPNSAQAEPQDRTRDTLAKTAGIGHETLRLIEKIEKKGIEALKEKVQVMASMGLFKKVHREKGW